MNQGSGTSILVAAVVGAAVGAGVALLFAPCSGKDTRGWLANRSREITDRTTSAFEQGRSAIRRATDAIGSDADAVTAKLRV
jgi:gas vesicle protein